MAISLLKTRDTVPNPRAAPVEQPWLGASHFQEMYILVYERCSERCRSAPYVIEVLILCPRQRHFIRSCIYNMYTVYV